MQFISRVLRLALVFSVFLILGLVLAVVVLGSWSAGIQNFVAFLFAVLATKWYRRRVQRRSSTDGQSKKKRNDSRSSRSRTKAKSLSSDHESSLKRSTNSQSRLKPVRPKGDTERGEPDLVSVSHGQVGLQGLVGLQSARGRSKRNSTKGAKFGNIGRDAWVTSLSSATIGGRDIGGLVYVGIPPMTGDFSAPSAPYIDPSLSISSAGDDMAGENLGYWPNYSTISPANRATYLNWLATGRNNSNYGVGYLFLYFYGLERRFFVDGQNSDAAELITEVVRLRDMYSENRSAQRYLGDFLDVAMLAEHSLGRIKPVFVTSQWEVPKSIKFAIGVKIAQGKAIDAEWLLSWFLTHPDRNLRTPAERCKDEFLALFKVRFSNRFPEGLKLNRPRKLLSVEYRAASGEFLTRIEPTFEGKAVPDVSSLRKPINIAQEIADGVMDELDKLSRYLGRNAEGRNSIEAHALLPQDLWGQFDNESVNQLRLWVQSVVDSGGFIPVSAIVEKLEGKKPDKLTKRNLTGAADALARVGFGLAPDPRFALRSPKMTEPVVLFELGESIAALEEVSERYRAALIEMAAKSFVAHADDEVTSVERAALFDSVEIYTELSRQEKRRLTANLDWMLAVPPDLALLRRKLKNADPETIAAVRSALVSAALADGVVQAEEVVEIEKIYKTLGLDTSSVYSDLHAGDVSDSLVKVRSAEPSPPGEAIPSDSGPRIPKLDASRIAAIRSDTERVSAVLGEIFTEDSVYEQESKPTAGMLDGLDEKHTKLVETLIDRVQWTEEELEELCAQMGLMVSGAIEAVNEWTFNVYDEALVEEYEVFEISIDTAEQIRKKMTEEL